MFLDFGENRPDTPRVVPALTRLERILLVIVGYQLLMLGYVLAPESWVAPVKQLVAPPDPIRFVEIATVPETKKLAKNVAPPSPVEPRAPDKPPVPAPADSALKNNARDNSLGPPNEPPKPAASPVVTGPSPNETPVVRRPSGGILGSARKTLGRITPDASSTNQTAGFDDNGPAIQFDDHGIDFGPWLRRFRAQVMRNWSIPQAAEVLHGHVAIQMRVLRDGTISNIHIVQSSGIDPFDRAAMTALRLSTPTLQLPDQFPLDSIDPFTVIFYYNEQVH